MCRYSHFHSPSSYVAAALLHIKDLFVPNVVPLFCHCSTVNIRGKSAYFQIPSIRAGETKRGLYGPFKAQIKDANSVFVDSETMAAV